jgi:hypothetical protein
VEENVPGFMAQVVLNIPKSEIKRVFDEVKREESFCDIWNERERFFRHTND